MPSALPPPCVAFLRGIPLRRDTLQYASGETMPMRRELQWI
jgi:hypothetical protein